MTPRIPFAALLLFLTPLAAVADDRLVRLYLPAALAETGVLKFFGPRFSLKTQVRLQPAATPDEADLAIGDAGVPLFDGLGQTWFMAVNSADHPGTQKLASWLGSDIGQRTFLSYAPDGEPLFSPPSGLVAVEEENEIEGDAALGLEVAQTHCSRCHSVAQDARMGGIGSTPSFAVLRSLPDWEDRFSAFYALNPHPAFTQIADITEPFPEERPSPITPVHLTLAEVEALQAYAASLEAADLGAPLAHQ